MQIQLDLLETHGELIVVTGRYSAAVREELLRMSAALIDRYLAPARATDQIRDKSTTKPSPLLRSSIKIGKAGDEVEAEPGFFDGDTVAHCGPTLKGKFARTLDLTDVHTGWVFTRTVRNNAHIHILGALKAGVDDVPFAVTGLDFDNGTEFLRKATWAAEREIFLPVAALQEERPGHHRVEEQPFGAQVRLLLPLRHHRGTCRAEPAMAAGQRPAQLPDPDQETDRVRDRPQRPTDTALRQARDAAGPAPGRQHPRPEATGRTGHLPPHPQLLDTDCQQYGWSVTEELRAVAAWRLCWTRSVRPIRKRS